jgi:CheY-like chemotaxis protein
VEERAPDVIVSDVAMPGEDGLSLIRRLRLLPPDRGGRTPAAALSAYASGEDRRLALQAGFQEHLRKPVEPAQLVAALARIVRDAAAAG